jgi:serine/threonine protein kinase
VNPAPSASPRSSLWRAGVMVGGRYRLRAPIGAGAMGEVWSADHVSLGIQVAVKLVDTAGRDDAQELLSRFQLEARAAAQLRSPHVVQILDNGAEGRVAFIAMELLEGESLERRIARRGALGPSEVAHVLREMARGVDRAHAAGIVHRDLKPPNVFLARIDGVEVTKVLDFGIAKILGAPRDVHLQTQAGFVVGTPAYMSPEQILGRPVDQRSDLWQMGVIAFECMTGKRPFDGQTLGQLFMAICTMPLPVPSSVGRVPPAFDAWFMRAVNRNPALRFGSAGEMAEALGSILAPGGAGESAIITHSSTPQRPDLMLPPVDGSHGAWSTARAEAALRRRTSPVVLLSALALAPVGLLTAGGLWWWASRRATPVDTVPALTTATTAPRAAPAEPPPAPPPTADTPAAPTAKPLATPASAPPRHAPPPVGPSKKPPRDPIGI